MRSPPPSPSRRSFDWRWVLLAVLWAVVALRIGGELGGRGAALWHHDLKTLHRDQVIFYRGEYPAAAQEQRQAAGPVASRATYPPYSFPLAMPWLPPGLGGPAVRGWFTLCQIAATAVVLAFVWSLGKNDDARLRWILVASVLAMTGLRADLLFGNFSVLMTALLVIMSRALESPRRWIAGTAWIASLLKPQMGWLFGVLFLSRRGWRVLAAAAVTVVALTLVTCWWTGVALVDTLPTSYFSRVSNETLGAERISLVSVLTSQGVAAGVALPACALAGIGVAAWVTHTRLRGAGTLAQMAFVGLVNRICTYHNACDDLLLVFALALLGRRAWRSGVGADWVAFLALGAAVWAPTMALQSTPARMLVVLVWIGVAVEVARSGGGDEAAAG